MVQGNLKLWGGGGGQVAFIFRRPGGQAELSGLFLILCVLSEICYKETILLRNYRKMAIVWSFSYNSFVNSHGKTIAATT